MIQNQCSKAAVLNPVPRVALQDIYLFSHNYKKR